MIGETAPGRVPCVSVETPVECASASSLATVMSRLEQAIKTIVEVFMENADGDGKLNKEEFQKLLDKEIESAEIKAKISAVGCDKIMGRVDKNHDGELNFGEFSKCVCFLANCCYHKMSGKGEECGHKCK